MAPNDREERRRMRQRGAGTSGLSVGNFGFTFGGPALPAQPPPRQTPKALPSRPSSRRTPAAATNPLPAQRSSRRTPASAASRRASNALPPQRSSRKSPAPLVPRASARKTPEEQPPAPAPGTSSAQSSRGAQRRSKTPSRSDEQTFVTPSATGKRKRQSAAQQVAESQEDELEQNNEQTLVTPLVTGKRKRPSAVQQVPGSQQDELEQNDEQYQASATKGHVESARRASGMVHATPRTVTADAEDELENNDVDHTLSTERRPLSSLKNLGSGRAASSPDLFVSQEEASPVPALKRPGRPRKSIGEPKNAVAGPSQTATKQPTRRSPQTAKVHEDLSEEEEVQEDDLSADELSPAVSRQQLETIQEDADSDASLFEEENADSSDDEIASHPPTPHISTSNIPHRAKPRGRPSLAKPAASVPKPRKAQPNTTAPARKPRSDALADGGRIPVTVYRLSAPRKPTDDALEIDELELPTPSAVANPRLPTVNAVDILAQITAELTARMASALRQQAAEAGTSSSDKPRRAELRRRAATVEAFATELADRLFELTEAVDAGEALRARLKAAAKEKVALRAEFLAIRREREQIALRMDAVRQAHMEAEAKRRHEGELSEALFGIETAVQRGREKAVREGREDEGPEVGALWEVDELLGSGVSAAGAGGGLADRVKEFNGFMERAAAVIEGRL